MEKIRYSTLQSLKYCPRCGESMPSGSASRARRQCTGCGLWFKSLLHTTRSSPDPIREDAPLHLVGDGFFSQPDHISLPRFVAHCIGFLVFLVWGISLIAADYRTGEIGQSFLHRPLLIFHEAGHVVFLPAGEFMHFLGGTLGQLLMPIILGIALLKKNHDPLGASLALWLLGVSLLDCAPYIYDALEPQLMLLSGGVGDDSHDWIYLLGELGILHHAQRLGRWVHFLGGAVIFLSAGWATVLLWGQWKQVQEA